MRLRGGPVGAFVSPQIARELSLDEKQREELREKGCDVELEYRRRLAELRLETQRQMLRLLTPEQQEKFRRLVGDPFEFEQQRAQHVPDATENVVPIR